MRSTIPLTMVPLAALTLTSLNVTANPDPDSFEGRFLRHCQNMQTCIVETMTAQGLDESLINMIKNTTDQECRKQLPLVAKAAQSPRVAELEACLEAIGGMSCEALLESQGDIPECKL